MMEEIRKAGKIKPFDVIDVLIMILFILIMAYPLWFIVAVSYTHLDVYKRQVRIMEAPSAMRRSASPKSLAPQTKGTRKSVLSI